MSRGESVRCEGSSSNENGRALITAKLRGQARSNRMRVGFRKLLNTKQYSPWAKADDGRYNAKGDDSRTLIHTAAVICRGLLEGCTDNWGKGEDWRGWSSRNE